MFWCRGVGAVTIILRPCIGEKFGRCLEHKVVLGRSCADILSVEVSNGSEYTVSYHGRNQGQTVFFAGGK